MGKTIDPDLALRLDALRQENGDLVGVEQIADAVGEWLERIEQAHSQKDVLLQQKLGGLAEYIKAVKFEVAALRPDDVQERYLPTAGDELDAIVAATEAATNIILAAAERIEAVATQVDADVSVRLIDITTGIYEACTFQDITGQRVGKVVKALMAIQEKVDGLIAAFGPMGGPTSGEQRKPLRTLPEMDADQALLNGPQLGDGVNQDDIDALFSG